jgi:hypothetical protein
MGLLSRAARAVTAVSEKPSSGLDEMGKALVNRILRLPPKKSAPYTALSLMKAYGSFQTGICLFLRNNVYTSYASVGLGIETITLPEDRIFSAEHKEESFFKHPGPAGLGIKNLDPAYEVWVFPLDGGAPWGSVLLLGSDGSPSFNPEVIHLIVTGILNIINPQIDKVVVKDSRKGSADAVFQAEDSSPEAAIERYQKQNPSFSCIVIDSPENPDGAEKDSFHQKMAQMTRFFGVSSALPGGRSMVLLPAALDRDLIAHRLSSSLKAKTLAVVSADSPDQALSEIRPYL